jgi:replication initiation protein RepC
MEHVSSILTPANGGRISTPKFREASRKADEFKGLPQDVTRFDLLKLVKHAGSELGFTDSMTRLLEHYMLFTKEQDWKEGSHPVVYQSQYKTALELGFSERQLQRLEGALFNVGALTWNDSGNRRRYGARDEDTGNIVYAYGVDLSPLASLYPVLQKTLQNKQLRTAAWMEQKRRISWYRSRIRAVLAEFTTHEELQVKILAATDKYDAISVHIRTYISLETLTDLCRKHESLYDQVLAAIEAASPTSKDCGLTQEESPRDDQNVVHKQTTNQPSSDKSETSSPQDNGFRGSVIRPSVITGEDGANVTSPGTSSAQFEEKIANISWKQVLNASSDRFQFYLRRQHGNSVRSLNMSDVVDAAGSIRSDLGISKSAWVDACRTLGSEGASICVMVIDQKYYDEEEPIRNPGGYLRGMVKKAREGKLNLHGGVFGLLKRGEGELNA